MKRAYRIVLKVVLWSVVCIVGLPVVLVLLLLGFGYISTYIYPEFWGSKDLGNGVYFMSGDNYYDASIVEGSAFDNNVCTGGPQILPQHWYDDKGDLLEYLVCKEFDDLNIIALIYNYQTTEHKYCILSKSFNPDSTSFDEIVNKYVFEFTDSLKFIKECEDRDISLRFDEKEIKKFPVKFKQSEPID